MNCKCGGKLATNDPKKIKYLKCKSCDAIVFKEAYGGKFSNKELAEIISGGEVYKILKNAKGKEYGAWVSYDFEKKKLDIDFKKAGPTVFSCVCGGDVKDCGILYKCEDCDSKMMKTISKLKISKTDAAKIFAGERIHFENFTKKDGETFDAYVVLKKGEWTTFEFDEIVESFEDEDDGFLAKEKEEKVDDVDIDGEEIDMFKVFDENGEDYE